MIQKLEVKEVINHLPCYYRTEELKPIIEKEFGDWIRSIRIEDSTEYGMFIDNIVIKIKNFLVSNYYHNIQTTVIGKPEKPKDNNDYDFDFGY